MAKKRTKKIKAKKVKTVSPKKKSKTKVVLLTVYFLICALCIGSFVAIKALAPEKIVVDQKNIELQALADGSQKEPVIEINYYKNTRGDGLELFEVRWNPYNNQDKQYFDSFGFQYVSTDKNSSINWEEYLNEDYTYIYEEHERSLWHVTYYVATQTSYRLSSGESYMYSSTDNFYTTIKNSNINLKEQLNRVQIGSDIYLMQPKGVNTEESYITNGGNYYDKDLGFVNDYYYWSYYSMDYNYVSYKLFDEFKNAKAGTMYYTFGFGDIFNFYKYDENSQSYKGDQVKDSALDKLINQAETNIIIKYNIYDSGAKTYHDSLFNSIKGNTSFNLTGEYVTEDYYYGRPVIELNALHFDFIHVAENAYSLRLNEKTIEALNSYDKEIALEVAIDLNIFEDNGFTFFGFTEDSGLEDYLIYRVYTVSADGTQTEVAYA